MNQIKKLAWITALCMLVNMLASAAVFAADTPAAETDEELPVLFSYDFNDEELPAIFSSFNFKAENGMLRAFGKWSEFSFESVPRNCSLEFKIKPVERRIIPRFVVKMRDDASFYYDNNAVISDDNSSRFSLISDADNQQKGDASVDSTNHLKAGEEYDLKYSAIGNTYEMYLNGEKIISAEYEPSELKSGIKFALEAADNTVGVIDFYIDDIVVRGKSSALDIPKDALYGYNFEDGKLPNGFSSADFAVENGSLVVKKDDAKFSFPYLAKDCSLEFTVRPIDGLNLTNFSVTIGNAFFGYVSNYRLNEKWDDKFAVYNAETWGKELAEKWANDTFFTDKQVGHKVKITSENDVYTLSIDGDEKLRAECPVTTPKEGYDLTFSVTGKGQFENPGFALDDIIVKGKIAGSDIPSDALYEYNFDDGVLPNELSAAAFVVEDGKMKSRGSSSSFSISGIPKNSYLEFKLSPAEGNVIPGFSTAFGNSSFTYVANFVQNATWDDKITMYNASTWKSVGEAWANTTDTFLPYSENTVKYFTDGTVYTLYINNKKIISGECPASKPMGRYNFTFRAGTAGDVKNLDFCIDDITVRTMSDEEIGADGTETGIAHVNEETWKTEKASDGTNYAGFDVELNIPEGTTVDSFYLTLNGKYSKLIKITPAEGAVTVTVPVVLKCGSDASAKDVKVYVREQK